MKMLVGIAFAAAVMMLISHHKKFLRWLNSIALILLTVSFAQISYRVFTEGPVTALKGQFYWDALSVLLLTVIVLVSDYVLLFSFGYMEHEVEKGEIAPARLSWYYFWIWLFIGSMLLVVSTPNLGIIWIGIEGTTIVTTLLVGFYRKKAAIEAAWKYIILGTVGISFALLGTLLLYAAASPILGYDFVTLNFPELNKIASQLNPVLSRLAFIFAFVGYGTKVGLVPMHPWLPDAHSQAPSPVSALLSGVLLNCALYAILRWDILIRQTALGPDFSGNLLIAFGILSLGTMVAFILLQKDVKRLLAYSSVEHMGIIALGFGLGTPLAVWGASLHLLVHALSKANLFLVSGRIIQKEGTRQMLKIRGLMGGAPLTAIVFLLGFLAITGTPPFGTFRSELAILSGLFERNHPFVGFLAILFITLIFAGCLYHFLGMLFAKASERGKNKENSRGNLGKDFSENLFERFLGKVEIIGLAIPILIVMGLGLFVPEGVDQILNQVVNIITGGMNDAGTFAEALVISSGR